MSRARNIKPGFFKNDALAECNPLARILFAGLWCEADREGRLENRPKRIKAECLPYDDCDIDALLIQLEERQFIQRYVVDGQAFIQIIEFAKHQNPHCKEAASSIPAPEQHGASTVQAPDKNRSSRADSPSLIPDSLIEEQHTPQEPKISARAEKKPVCGKQDQESGTSVSPAAELTIPLRQHGKLIAPSHPDVIAAAAEGVNPQAIVDLIEQYPDKPAVYLIAAARRQHAEGARDNHARAGPAPRKSRTLQAIESLNQVTLDEDGNPTYRPTSVATRRDSERAPAAALPGPGRSASG